MCDVKIGRLGKFDFNPRGELWRKDENRFGHKFLSKFGWSQGKGLGKNEDGIAENLKVRIKVGNTGVGWNETLPIGIDYREYDAVLEDLSKRYQKSGEVKNVDISLEKRSQQFKNRIHYQKFVRGKDISRYSEKDMSCIFLSRESEKEVGSPAKASTVTNTESCPSHLSTKAPMPTFNSQLSIADYFALKMKNKTGSSFSSSKESKCCGEASQLETDIKSKKRKYELKYSKKAKQLKHESEYSTTEESLADEEDTTESSSSTPETSKDNLFSKEQFQNSEKSSESGKKKSSKKMKKILGTFKSKQDIANHGQEKYKAVEENYTENKGSTLVQSHESFSNFPEKSKNMVGNEIMSKKRKKEQKSSKKAKKHCLGEAEISTSVEKNSSHIESEDVERNSSEKCIAKSLKTEKQSCKESERHKNKISSLKSCLKSCLSNNKYSFKEKRNVSFCENNSYKLIENVLNNMNSDIVLETNEQLLSCSDEDYTDGEVAIETENIEINLHDNLNFSDKSTYSDEQFGDKLEHTDVSCHESSVNSYMVEDNTVPECFKLPKRSSTNYDSWLETQRIAARMKVYKNMVKKMKKHPVLRKTNLLEIKGYGNWGL